MINKMLQSPMTFPKRAINYNEGKAGTQTMWQCGTSDEETFPETSYYEFQYLVSKIKSIQLKTKL